jgi:hypothetical protein
MKKALNAIIKITLILICLLPFSNASAQTICPAPGAIPATFITSTSATLNWTISGTGTNPSFILQYRNLSTAGSPWVTVTTNGISYNLTNLTPANVYEYLVAQYCVNPNGVLVLSLYSNSILFTTLPSTTTCPTPTGLTTTNITSNSALLSWQPGLATYSYNVRYRMANTANWTVVSGPNTSLPLSNLLSSTTYEWQVQTICSNSTPNTLTSPYSASVFFTTLPSTSTCNTPTNLSESNITNTSATLNWNTTGASSYHIRYRISTSTTWIYKSSTTNSKSITGLISGGIYTWQARSICVIPGNVSIKSPWSALRTFTTLVQSNCPAPQALTAGNVTSTSALVSWMPVTTATNYQVSYRIVSPVNPNTSWIYVYASTTSLLLQNLLGGSVYECRVRSNCSPAGTNGSLGPWSTSILFTTPVLIAVHPNPASEKVIFSLASDENVNSLLQVFDFTGNVIHELNSNLISGENNLNLDVTLLNDGIYTYQFTQGSRISRGKFIVKH